ncbi:hypothetical protein ABPG72_005379 [Tetrahymena utriculariae]
MNSIPLETNLQRSTHQNLIYTYGKVDYQNRQLANDDLFKISSSSLDFLGLYRKVEVFHNFSANHQYNCKWQDSRLFENIFTIPNQLYLGSKVATNGDIFLEGYKLISPCCINLEYYFGNRIKKETQQNKINKENNINQSSLEIEKAENPLEKLIFSGRHVEIKDQFIYIMKNKGQINKGDIRISFHEINKITTATLLALQEDGILKERKLFNSQEKIEYFVNGNKEISYVSLFSFLTKKGFVDYKDIIHLFKTALKLNVSNQYKNILLHFIIISCLYLFIELQLFGNSYFNLIDRKQLLQQIQELQSNQDIIKFQNSYNINKEILKKSFIQSSIHTISLKILTSGFLLLPCTLGTIILLYQLDKQCSMTELIDNIKNDLQEIRKNSQDNSVQQIKDFLNKQN